MSEHVLGEQITYYRRRAAEYDETAYGELPAADDRIAGIVSRLPAAASVLEIACGTGRWTAALARRTRDLTAVDAAPEALDIARSRCPESVQFICADVFRWLPSQTFDLVFFGFWLSHVPTSSWPDFFDRLGHCLSPSGHIAFVDEHVSQAAKEQFTGDSEVIERTISDGSVHRLVKAFIDPAPAAERLAGLGWSCEIVPDGDDWVVGIARRAAGH